MLSSLTFRLLIDRSRVNPWQLVVSSRSTRQDFIDSIAASKCSCLGHPASSSWPWITLTRNFCFLGNFLITAETRCTTSFPILFPFFSLLSFFASEYPLLPFSFFACFLFLFLLVVAAVSVVRSYFFILRSSGSSSLPFLLGNLP